MREKNGKVSCWCRSRSDFTKQLWKMSTVKVRPVVFLGLLTRSRSFLTRSWTPSGFCTVEHLHSWRWFAFSCCWHNHIWDPGPSSHMVTGQHWRAFQGRVAIPLSPPRAGTKAVCWWLWNMSSRCRAQQMELPLYVVSVTSSATACLPDKLIASASRDPQEECWTRPSCQPRDWSQVFSLGYGCKMYEQAISRIRRTLETAEQSSGREKKMFIKGVTLKFPVLDAFVASYKLSPNRRLRWNE